MRNFVPSATLFIVVLLGSISVGSPINKGRKNTEIENIMQAGFGGYPPGFKRPMAKVLSSTATKEETEKLVELCKKLTEQKPLKADVDMKEWKKVTEELLSATKAVAAGGDGKEEALKRLKAASDCKSCHDKFKATP